MTTETLQLKFKQSPWSTLAPFGLLLLIYLPAVVDLVSDWWNDDNYSHGFLIPVVSAWLLWQKREKLSTQIVSRDNKGLILLLAGISLFVAANAGAEYFSLRVSMVVCLFGLIYFMFGRELVRMSWFEIAFLCFMMPIPYVIYFAATFPMQLLASKVTAFVLNAIGMGVVRQGNIIHIQGFSLEVAEACSGLRSIMSLLALGALYAHLTQRRMSSKLILFLSTIPIAVLANVLRVLVTSLIAYTVSDQVTAEPMHSIMGMSVFVIAFLLMSFVSSLLKRLMP
ncbi:MAG: exosortase/archaeosortase family protein [candidate division Zixibacteria bacterium]